MIPISTPTVERTPERGDEDDEPMTLHQPTPSINLPPELAKQAGAITAQMLFATCELVQGVVDHMCCRYANFLKVAQAETERIITALQADWPNMTGEQIFEVLENRSEQYTNGLKEVYLSGASAATETLAAIDSKRELKRLALDARTLELNFIATYNLENATPLSRLLDPSTARRGFSTSLSGAFATTPGGTATCGDSGTNKARKRPRSILAESTSQQALWPPLTPNLLPNPRSAIDKESIKRACALSIAQLKMTPKLASAASLFRDELNGARNTTLTDSQALDLPRISLGEVFSVNESGGEDPILSPMNDGSSNGSETLDEHDEEEEGEDEGEGEDDEEEEDEDSGDDSLYEDTNDKSEPASNSCDLRRSDNAANRMDSSMNSALSPSSETSNEDENVGTMGNYKKPPREEEDDEDDDEEIDQSPPKDMTPTASGIGKLNILRAPLLKIQEKLRLGSFSAVRNAQVREVSSPRKELGLSLKPALPVTPVTPAGNQDLLPVRRLKAFHRMLKPLPPKNSQDSLNLSDGNMQTSHIPEWGHSSVFLETVKRQKAWNPYSIFGLGVRVVHFNDVFQTPDFRRAAHLAASALQKSARRSGQEITREGRLNMWNNDRLSNGFNEREGGMSQAQLECMIGFLGKTLDLSNQAYESTWTPCDSECAHDIRRKQPWFKTEWEGGA